MGRVVVNVWFWLVALVTVPLCTAAAALVWLVTAPFDPGRRLLHAFLCRWAHAYLFINPHWKVKVVHRARLPKGAAVLVANHQSVMDILAVTGLRHQFKFVSKKSVFAIPFVGWSMRLARYVPLARGNPASMSRMLKICRAWLRRGVAVLLFPEGTYGPPGALLPFRKGAFVLAKQENVPLVPVLIEGTRGLVDGDGPWLSARCHIRVTVLEPIPAAQLPDDAGRAAARVRALFEEALRPR